MKITTEAEYLAALEHITFLFHLLKEEDTTNVPTTTKDEFEEYTLEVERYEPQEGLYVQENLVARL